MSESDQYGVIYTFYRLGEHTQCPLSVKEWPGHVRSSRLGSIIRDLLRNRGEVIEVVYPGRRPWCQQPTDDGGSIKGD
jgi:hypothetical protein